MFVPANGIAPKPQGSHGLLNNLVFLATSSRRYRLVQIEPGTPSAEVASALAEGIQKRTGANLGVEVTGIARSTGSTESKPMGLVYFAVSDSQKIDSFNRTLRGDRARARQWAAQQALDLIRRKLMWDRSTVFGPRASIIRAPVNIHLEFVSL